MGRIKKDFYAANAVETINAALAEHSHDIIRVQCSGRNADKFVMEQASNGERVQAVLNLEKYQNRHHQGIAFAVGMGFEIVSTIINGLDLWMIVRNSELSLAEQWKACAIKAADLEAEGYTAAKADVVPQPNGLPAVVFGDVPNLHTFKLGPDVWTSLDAEA